MSRRLLMLWGLPALLVFGWLFGRGYLSSRQQLNQTPGPAVNKQPVAVARRTFDPTAPPADMPRLGSGEEAECDSEFLSNASVSGESEQKDATHATVTITRVKVTLQLNITIWVPPGISQHVIEHEEGHRQISEHYYESADKLAERIAATYIGKQLEITGADLHEESSNMLQQAASDIRDEYNRQLNPGPTQLLYDAITDHGRNEVIVKDAVIASIQNIKLAPTHQVN